MHFDLTAVLPHTAILLSVYGLYRQNKRNHKANIEAAKIAAYRADLMWVEFCKLHGIDAGVDGASKNAGG